MESIVSCIEILRQRLDKHRKDDLKELPTRTIFIDPLLQALDWDVRDPDEVELEYPTIDGKSVDYAPKINGKPILFVEAKALNDPLTDVKSITQVVGYAANAGIDWCILTNGITYKVYRSTEKAEAPDKLLYEVSLDPKQTQGMSNQQLAEQFVRFSREAMAKGLLDEIGEQVFTTGKIRKAFNQLLIDPSNTLVRLIRSKISDDSIGPEQVRNALKRLGGLTTQPESISIAKPSVESIYPSRSGKKGKDYGEGHHVKDQPQEVVELYRSLDKFCTELDPTYVTRKYISKSINYSHGNNIFCCVHLQKSGLRVWLKLKYAELESPPEYVRDVSNVGHWGTGDIEVAIDSISKLQDVKALIQKSFYKNRAK
ncbi:MAG: DUF5655 domain-containing protein [Planctomycetota bacterium]